MESIWTKNSISEEIHSTYNRSLLFEKNLTIVSSHVVFVISLFSLLLPQYADRGIYTRVTRVKPRLFFYDKVWKTFSPIWLAINLLSCPTVKYPVLISFFNHLSSRTDCGCNCYWIGKLIHIIGKMVFCSGQTLFPLDYRLFPTLWNLENVNSSGREKTEMVFIAPLMNNLSI